MREFSDKAKFSVRSLPEIFETVSNLVSRFRARGLGLGGKMTREVLLNSLFLHFASLPVDRQSEILRDGMARLGAMLAEAAPGGDAAGPVPSTVDVPIRDVTPKSRAKKSG